MGIISKILGISLVIIILLSGSYFFYSQHQLKVLNALNGAQQVAISTQNAAILSIQSQYDKLNKLNGEYSQQLNRLRTQDSQLRNQLNQAISNASKNPRATEKAINQHQNQIFSDLRNLNQPAASGATAGAKK
jgi:chromosome segregation ATPase